MKKFSLYDLVMDFPIGSKCFVAIMFKNNSEQLADYDIVKRNANGLKLLAASRGNWAEVSTILVPSVDRVYQETPLWTAEGGSSYVRLMRPEDIIFLKPWKYVSQELQKIKMKPMKSMEIPNP